MEKTEKITKKIEKEKNTKEPIPRLSNPVNKLIYWTPRILTIIYILFISMFALDVFGEYQFPKVLLALFMHLLPIFLLIVILSIAWKRPKIGGWIFLLWGIIFTFFFNTYKNPVNLMLISLPLFITGGLFFLDDKINHQKSP